MRASNRRRGRPPGQAAANQEKVRQLAESGLSDQQIATEIGLSATYVGLLRTQAGIHRPKGPQPGQRAVSIAKVAELALADQTDEQIALATGLSILTVREYRHAAGIYYRRGRKTGYRRSSAPKWSEEQIADLRERLKTTTLREVGEHYGISREYVRQLAGNVNRHHPPGWQAWNSGRAEQNRELVVKAALEGQNDEQIAKALGLSLSYVRLLRYQGGIMRRYRVQTKEHALWCLDKWIALYGYVPAATDWNEAAARKMGHVERADRCKLFRAEFGCPYPNAVARLFGSWNEFIREGGHQPRTRGTHFVPWRMAQPQV